MGKTRKRLALLLAAAVSIGSGALTAALGRDLPAEDCAVKLEAARSMQACMDFVRARKAALGLALSPDDWHGTGMIGEPYTAITTTSGALEAKRTTANPDMAALVVQLLTQAGVQPGDTVGAGFSGSFPAMDLAVLSACQALGVNIVYTASAGASTYGANQPEYTLPDMVWDLSRQGLAPAPAAFSMGGALDCGLDMDPAAAAAIRARLEGDGVPFLYEEDYGENLARRTALYDAAGIVCFIGVGGNLTTSGRTENDLSYTWGVIPPNRAAAADEKSGLMQIYNARGLPVIHLLNIKHLVADYGLAYDPETLPPAGTSAVYFAARYPWPIAGLGLACAVGILLQTHRREREETP